MKHNVHGLTQNWRGKTLLCSFTTAILLILY